MAETDHTGVPGHAQRTQHRQEVLRSKGAFPISYESVRRKLFFQRQEVQRSALIEELRKAASCSLLYNTDDPIVVEDSTTKVHRRQRRRFRSRRAREGANVEPGQAPDKDGDTMEDVGTRAIAKKKTQRKTAKKEAVPTAEGVRWRLRFTKKQLSTMREFASYLVHPDNMVEVPSDLNIDWLCYVRPEGPRCLVLTDNGRAYVRAKNGRFMMDFPTIIPPGCILDCVYIKVSGSRRLHSERDVADMEMQDGIDQRAEEMIPETVDAPRESRVSCFYIVDVLCWNECCLVDSPLACRSFFLKSRFEEMEPDINILSPMNSKMFKILDMRRCQQRELEDLYYSDLGYKKDSMIFVHQEAHCMPGLNPLYLCWKDPHLSSWYVDSSSKEGVQSTSPITQRLHFCLELNRDGQLRTQEGEWGDAGAITPQKANVIFSSVGCTQQEILVKASAETLEVLKYDTREDSTEARDEQSPHQLVLIFHGLRILSVAPAPRLFADSFHRIVYQYVSRANHLKRLQQQSSEAGSSDVTADREDCLVAVESNLDVTRHSQPFGGYDVLSSFREITFNDILAAPARDFE